MILKSIKLASFRSYKEKEFKFPRGTILVVGPNTSGKTNLLEGIYLLATGRSFRAGVEAEMIKYGEELARVSGVILDGRSATLRTQNSTENTELEIVLTTGQVIGKRVAKKRYVVNGVGKRMVDFVGQLRCVLFGPEDLKIVLGSPSIRRNYLDSVLEQVDWEYRRANLSYQKGLRQRNKLLEQIREEGKPRSILFFWDKLLVENGEVITQKREGLIDFVNQQPDHFGKLRVRYDKSIISPRRLEKYTEQEVAAGMTLAGPHRDDFCMRIYPNENSPNGSESFGKTSTMSSAESLRTNLGRDLAVYGSRGEPRKSRDLSIYGSRGEQRTAVLSLKLAELEFMTEKTKARPVLLLDDIFSELDQAHRERVFEIIPKQQTIITTTDARLVTPIYRKKVEIIEFE